MTSPWAQTPPPRREPFFNMAPIVAWTALLLFGLYMIYFFLPDDLQAQTLLNYAFIPARFDGLPRELAAFTPESTQWTLLTMVTHAGLHGGIGHVVFNSLWLVIFGTIVVRATGPVGYLVIFLVGAMAGAAMFYLFHPGSLVPVVGASGGVSALMGAAVRLFFGRGTASLLDTRVIGFTAAWLVINLLFGISGFQAGEGSQIAWEAHMGGYFFGLITIPLFAGFPRRYG